MSNAICQPRAGLSFLDRYLTLWICAAMAGGVLFERRFFARARSRGCAERDSRVVIMTIVLFACVHNAGRSQMAAGFFNATADPAKARAVSAGTRPADRVNPVVVEAMREAGIDLSAGIPQRLTAELAREARWLITMGCGDQCPVVPGVLRGDWRLDDPADQPLERVRSIRDDIRARVQAFVEREGL